MASIHRKEGSRNWFCCYALPCGKRVYRTTGTPNRADAMRRACEIEADALAVAREGNAPQRVVLEQVQEAAALSKRGALSLDAAREIMSRIVAASTGRAMRFYTVRQWGEEWLAGKKGSAAKSSQSTYSLYVNGFVSFLGPMADEPIDRLDETHFRKYRDDYRAKKHAARTCNQALKVLRGWMKTAVSQGLLPRNPAAAVPMLIEDDSIARAPYDADELQRIIRAADGSWRGVILLGIYGGLRLRDATGLRWSSVDMKQGVIRFLPLKTARSKREVVLPMHPALREFFGGLPVPIHPSNLVFPDLAGKSSGGRFGLSIGFNTILADAKIERDVVRIEADGKRVVIARRSFHSLRHTFASMLAKGGVGEGLRMELAGHKTPEMARHYTHHELETLREAVGTLPVF